MNVLWPLISLCLRVTPWGAASVAVNIALATVGIYATEKAYKKIKYPTRTDKIWRGVGWIATVLNRRR